MTNRTDAEGSMTGIVDQRRLKMLRDLNAAIRANEAAEYERWRPQIERTRRDIDALFRGEA